MYAPSPPKKRLRELFLVWEMLYQARRKRREEFNTATCESDASNQGPAGSGRAQGRRWDRGGSVDAATINHEGPEGVEQRRFEA